MIKIDELMVGDTLWCGLTKKEITIKGFPMLGSRQDIQTGDAIFCQSSCFHESLTRIPVTAENFPEDGIVWHPAFNVVGKRKRINDTIADGCCLPLQREKQAYLGKRDDVKMGDKDLLPCQFCGDKAEIIGNEVTE